jgi:superfamily II DNA or RNA helicase
MRPKKAIKMSAFSVDDIPWGEPKVIQTRVGPRRVREWKVPEEAEQFWKLWRTGYLRQQGYSLSKWKGEWQLTEWRQADGTEPLSVRPAVRAAQERNGIQHRQEQVEPELPADLRQRFDEVVAIYEEIHEETGNDYSYQLPSIKRLAAALDSFNGALDGSDTGAGKTPVACAVAYILQRRLFVVCPKNVIPPWRRMARRFGVQITVINYEMLRMGNTEVARWIKRKNPRTGRFYKTFAYSDAFEADTWLFVFDECHRMKDHTTKNCQMGVAALDQGFKVMGLSATAADNPLHMKFTGLLTGLFDQPSYFFAWLRDHGVRKGRWGMEFVGGRDVLSRIHRQIFPARGSRIRVADLGDRFPQTTIISEAYEMNGATSEIQTIYDEMHEAISILEASQRKDKGSCILTEILRARQKVELLKVPTIVQMANDARDEGMAVVVIVNFQQSVDEIAKRLRTVNTITGSDTMEHRMRLIDRFNADDEDIVVLNIKAGGLGIDLHGTSQGKHRMVLISPTYSGIDLKQALGRCHRAGGAKSIQKIVWAAGTLEERVCDKVRERLQRVSIFNDDALDANLAI